MHVTEGLTDAPPFPNRTSCCLAPIGASCRSRQRFDLVFPTIDLPGSTRLSVIPRSYNAWSLESPAAVADNRQLHRL